MGQLSDKGFSIASYLTNVDALFICCLVGLTGTLVFRKFVKKLVTSFVPNMLEDELLPSFIVFLIELLTFSLYMFGFIGLL